MRRYSTVSWIIPGLIIVLLTFPWQSARADTGPKPSMDFTIEYAIQPPPELASGLMVTCADQNCASPQVFGGHCSDSSTPDPMELTNPGEGYCYQRMECSKDRCTAYNTYVDYYRLDFTFSDGKTRISNVFGKEYFYAQYLITVRQDDLLVEELRGYAMPITSMAVLSAGIPLLAMVIYLGIMITLAIRMFGRQEFAQDRGRYVSAWIVTAMILASCSITTGFFGGKDLLASLLTTLAVELALGFAYALWRKHPVVYLLTIILLMNMITQPLLWLALTGGFVGSSMVWTLTAEIGVCLVEAWILFKALPGKITNKEALLLSLVLNAASFGVGLILPFR